MSPNKVAYGKCPWLCDLLALRIIQYFSFTDGETTKAILGYIIWTEESCVVLSAACRRPECYQMLPGTWVGSGVTRDVKQPPILLLSTAATLMTAPPRDFPPNLLFPPFSPFFSSSGCWFPRSPLWMRPTYHLTPRRITQTAPHRQFANINCMTMQLAEVNSKWKWHFRRRQLFNVALSIISEKHLPRSKHCLIKKTNLFLF